MRASLFSIINSYFGALKLVYKKNTTARYFPFRNLALTCSLVLENNVVIPEDSEYFFPENLEWVSTVSEHNGFSLGGKEMGGFSCKGSLFFENLKNEDEMERIKLVLVNRGWDLGIENRQRIELNELNVVRVLNDLFDETSNAALAFQFFKWCERYTDYRHSVHSICTMIYILVSGNMNHRAVDLLLSLARSKDGREEWHHLLFTVLKETCRDGRVLETVYSMLVNSYVREKKISMALKLVDQMKTYNFFPSIGVCNSLLRALLESKKMELAWEFLGEMHIRGMNDACIISLFIHSFCAEGSLASACKLLVEMQNYGFRPDVVAYTIVINAICKIGMVKEATTILFKMGQMGLSPDTVLVTSVVDGYCKTRRFAEAMYILKVFSFAPNIFLYNSFISKLCRDGQMEEAAELFHEMSELGMHPDCCSYTTIIGGYCKVGKLDEALKYLGEMLKRGFKPAIITYTVLVDSYCKIGDIEMAEYLFRMIEREGLKPDVVTYNTLMDGYGKKGYLHKTFELLDMMKLADVLPDSVTYNIIIHGLVNRGFVKESRNILEELIRRGFSPNVLAFTNIISGFSKEGSFEEAFLMWSYMSKHGMRPDVVTCSALLSGYCKAHHMEEANVLFRKMLDAGLDPDLILYNTLIYGFCSEGNIYDACHLVCMMTERGIIPNDVTFRAMVHGFEKSRIENPVENAAIRMQRILLKYGIDFDISQYMSMLYQSSS